MSKRPRDSLDPIDPASIPLPTPSKRPKRSASSRPTAAPAPTPSTSKLKPKSSRSTPGSSAKPKGSPAIKESERSEPETPSKGKGVGSAATLVEVEEGKGESPARGSAPGNIEGEGSTRPSRSARPAAMIGGSGRPTRGSKRPDETGGRVEEGGVGGGVKVALALTSEQIKQAKASEYDDEYERNPNYSSKTVVDMHCHLPSLRYRSKKLPHRFWRLCKCVGIGRQDVRCYAAIPCRPIGAAKEEVEDGGENVKGDEEEVKAGAKVVRQRGRGKGRSIPKNQWDKMRFVDVPGTRPMCFKMKRTATGLDPEIVHEYDRTSKVSDDLAIIAEGEDDEEILHLVNGVEFIGRAWVFPEGESWCRGWTVMASPLHIGFNRFLDQYGKEPGVRDAVARALVQYEVKMLAAEKIHQDLKRENLVMETEYIPEENKLRLTGRVIAIDCGDVVDMNDQLSGSHMMGSFETMPVTKSAIYVTTWLRQSRAKLQHWNDTFREKQQAGWDEEDMDRVQAAISEMRSTSCNKAIEDCDLWSVGIILASMYLPELVTSDADFSKEMQLLKLLITSGDCDELTYEQFRDSLGRMYSNLYDTQALVLKLGLNHPMADVFRRCLVRPLNGSGLLGRYHAMSSDIPMARSLQDILSDIQADPVPMREYGAEEWGVYVAKDVMVETEIDESIIFPTRVNNPFSRSYMELRVDGNNFYCVCPMVVVRDACVSHEPADTSPIELEVWGRVWLCCHEECDKGDLDRFAAVKEHLLLDPFIRAGPARSCSITLSKMGIVDFVRLNQPRVVPNEQELPIDKRCRMGCVMLANESI